MAVIKDCLTCLLSVFLSTKSIGSHSLELPLVTKVYGSIHSTAYYMTDVAIGSPVPQRQSLIVDTGSSVTAFGCNDCDSCGDHIDPLYDRSNSTTVKMYPCGKFPGDFSNCRQCDRSIGGYESQCAYSIAYLEGSELRGKWFTDVVWLGHLDEETDARVVGGCESCVPTGTPVVIPFGCHKVETHLFVDQLASGIMGLEAFPSSGPDSFVRAAVYGLVDTYFSSSFKNIPLLGFALCLSENGGVYSIGDFNRQFHITEMPGDIPSAAEENGIQWTDIVSTHSYNILLTGISVGRMTFGVAGGVRALVDSGTTVSYFPMMLYYQIVIGIEDTVPSLGFRRLLRESLIPGSSPQTPKSAIIHLTGTPLQRIRARIESVLNEQTLGQRHLAQDTTVASIKTATDEGRRLLEQIDEIATTRGSSLDHKESQPAVNELLEYLESHPSAEPRNVAALKMEGYYREECWYLPNPRSDIRDFPNIIVELGGGAKYTWEPQSYLYAKGTEEIRCLAIVPLEQSRNLVMSSIGDYGHDVVLGSSFFINHDVIFDVAGSLYPASPSSLHRDRIGFAKAQCPSYRHADRVSKFTPHPKQLYGSMLNS